MPVIWGGASVGDRTFGELAVQYWDGDSWEAIDATGNPIEDWLIPTTDDGSQVKELEFDAISTTKIRVYFAEANASGDAGLEEIQAYGPEECSPSVNLAASANGGSASASSTWSSGGAPGTLIDGATQGGSLGWWADDPSGPEPAWAQVAWTAEQTLTKVVLRMPVVTSGATASERTFGELVVQYWDGDSWEAIDATGNPIEDWLVPTTDDGSQTKELDFDAINTTKIRVLFVEDNASSDAGLEEIEAYGPDGCPPPPDSNLALSANGGSASASSTWVYSGAPGTLIDGVVQSSGWWADHPSGPKPGWAQVAWDEAQTLDRVVLRMPVIWGGASVGDRTFGELAVQYWDGDSWEAIDATGNPIEDWLIPTTDDGSQVKELEFDAISTTKIRVYFAEANASGDAGLEEIQAYGP